MSIDDPWADMDEDENSISFIETAVIQCTAIEAQNPLWIEATFSHNERTKTFFSNIPLGGRLMVLDAGRYAHPEDFQGAKPEGCLQVVHQDFLCCPLAEPIAGVLLDAGILPHHNDPSDIAWQWRKPQHREALDLRTDMSVMPAWQWLQTVTAAQLGWVIHECGEEEDALLAARIAEEVLCHQKLKGPYSSTEEFVQVVSKAKGKSCDTHFPKMVCEAIRIWLNQEFERLDQILDAIFQKLQMNGRCVIMCYKRRELMRVREFLRRHEEPERLPSPDSTLFPLLDMDKRYAIREVVAPIKPNEDDDMRFLTKQTTLVVLEKVPRRFFGSVAPLQTSNLFREPTTLPNFAGHPADVGSSAAAEFVPPLSHAEPPSPESAPEEEQLKPLRHEVLRRVVAVHEYVTDSKGYLSLAVGEEANVIYVGEAPDDEGWLYGYVLQCDDEQPTHSRQGWFPQDVIAEFL